jgi:hypothetical protein
MNGMTAGRLVGTPCLPVRGLRVLLAFVVLLAVSLGAVSSSPRQAHAFQDALPKTVSLPKQVLKAPKMLGGGPTAILGWAAFQVGYEAGYYGMELIFGPQGDNRGTVTSGTLPAPWGFYVDSGSACNGGPCAVPSLTPQDEWPSTYGVRIVNALTAANGGVSTQQTALVRCKRSDGSNAPEASQTSVRTGDMAPYSGLGSGWAVGRATVGASSDTCGAVAGVDTVPYEVQFTSAGQLIWRWAQDLTPNAPLEIVPKVTCRNATSEVVTSLAPQTVNPAPDAVATIDVDADCGSIIPDGSWAGTTLSAGRAGEPKTDIATAGEIDPAMEDLYPRCVPGGDLFPCQLAPQKKSDSRTCYSPLTNCTTWPAHATDYSCMWGPYSVPRSWCLDAFPQAWPAPSTNPSASPSATPSTGTDPPPGTEPGGGPSGEPGPGESPYCPSSWWAILNPFALYETLKCAFVPRTSTMTALKNSVASAWSDTSVADTYNGVTAPITATAAGVSAAGSGGSCLGPALTIPDPIDRTFRPLSSCNQPQKFMAELSYAATAAGMVFAAMVMGLRLVAGAFGLSLPVGTKQGNNA